MKITGRNLRVFTYAMLSGILFASANFADAGDAVSSLRFFRDIESENGPGGIARVNLDRTVFEKIDSFSDIRVIDASGTEIPFRVEKQFSKKQELRKVVCPSKVLSLKKYDDNKIEIIVRNQSTTYSPAYLTFRTASRNYDKQVSVARGTMPDKWGETEEAQGIFDYSAIIDLSNNTISLPREGKGDCYRITISNFSEIKQSGRMEIIEERRDGRDYSEIKKKIMSNDDFQIGNIILEAEEAFDYDKAPVTALLESEIISTENIEKKTQIVIDTHRQPVFSMEINTPAVNFSRNIGIQVSGDMKQWNFSANGKISKISIGKYHKEELKISLPETRRRYLKILIDNGDAPTLRIENVKCSGPVYSAEFLIPDNQSGTRLYYGGSMPAPSYDINEILAKIANPEYRQLRLGVEKINPGYDSKASKKSFIESKVLMYIIIGIMVLVLAAALLSGLKKIEDMPAQQ